MTNGKKVLIVEDEERMMSMLKDAFEADGFTVLEAGSAEAAMTRVIKETPDIVILDLMLPGMDGMKFFNELREKEGGKKLPVIVLTNVTPDDQIMAGVVRNEPAYYIVKANTSMAEIVSKVKISLGMMPMHAV